MEINPQHGGKKEKKKALRKWGKERKLIPILLSMPQKILILIPSYKEAGSIFITRLRTVPVLNSSDP
jgi:hypothetical protein